MSDMTGEQLAQEIRQLRSDIPVILCTGFSHTISAEKAQAAGIDAFCMKPFTARELALTIEQVLQTHTQFETSLGERILLIDDDDQLRGGLRQMMESAGYTVIEARNGRDGMQQYRNAPPDLIITNLLMPEQEGLETIRQLRDTDPNVKIIAISGGIPNDSLDILQVARQFGAQKTLRKPFSRDELLAAIQEVLQS